MILNKYLEIKNLAHPQKTFDRLENEFIDIMYPDSVSVQGVIMLLDVNINPNEEKDIIWMKQLLDNVLPDIGEKQYYLIPVNP